MDKVLLDTDILSEVLKGVDQNVRRRAQTYRAVAERYTTSAVTIMEIVRGYRRARQDRRLEAFLAIVPELEVLVVDATIADLAGRIHADLELAGRPISWIDPMIAAVALVHDLTLVTGNTAHYQRIVDLGHSLRLDNWRT
jgi:predicted nucleic acid-binding protein